MGHVFAVMRCEPGKQSVKVQFPHTLFNIMTICQARRPNHSINLLTSCSINILQVSQKRPSTLLLCEELLVKFTTALLPTQNVEVSSEYAPYLACSVERAMDSYSRPHY